MRVCVGADPSRCKHCSTLQHSSAAANNGQMGISVLCAPSHEICRMGVPMKAAVLRTHTIRKETVLRQGSPTFLRPWTNCWIEKWSRDRCHMTYKIDFNCILIFSFFMLTVQSHCNSGLHHICWMKLFCTNFRMLIPKIEPVLHSLTKYDVDFIAFLPSKTVCKVKKSCMILIIRKELPQRHDSYLSLSQVRIILSHFFTYMTFYA